MLNDGGEKQQEIVKLLLDNGANPHMTDKYGKTPLELAREKATTRSPTCCWRPARKDDGQPVPAGRLIKAFYRRAFCTTAAPLSAFRRK